MLHLITIGLSRSMLIDGREQREGWIYSKATGFWSFRKAFRWLENSLVLLLNTHVHIIVSPLRNTPEN